MFSAEHAGTRSTVHSNGIFGCSLQGSASEQADLEPLSIRVKEGLGQASLGRWKRIHGQFPQLCNCKTGQRKMSTSALALQQTKMAGVARSELGEIFRLDPIARMETD